MFYATYVEQCKFAIYFHYVIKVLYTQFLGSCDVYQQGFLCDVHLFLHD